MKKYQRPVVMINDGYSEGVYAGSGKPECWTIRPVSVQDWSGSHHVFEIQCVHSKSVEHISAGTEVVLTFNTTLTDAYSEFPCTFSGNTVVIKRELLGDSYRSGDNMTYKVWVKASDELSTRSIACIGATISCDKTVNVQGNGADGN